MSSDKVNFSTESREEIGKINGGSEQCAGRIIAERERRGGFKDIAEVVHAVKWFGLHLRENANVQ